MDTKTQKLAAIITSKGFTFEEMLDYMKQYSKYNTVTYRDLDKAFGLINNSHEEPDPSDLYREQVEFNLTHNE